MPGTEAKKVGIILADYDSCFDFDNSRNGHQSLEAFNQYPKVVTELLNYKAAYHELILMSGSNRQDLELDFKGHEQNKKGLSFQILPMLAYHLGMTPDLFLLSGEDEINKLKAFCADKELNFLTDIIPTRQHSELKAQIG